MCENMTVTSKKTKGTSTVRLIINNDRGALSKH